MAEFTCKRCRVMAHLSSYMSSHPLTPHMLGLPPPPHRWAWHRC